MSKSGESTKLSAREVWTIKTREFIFVINSEVLHDVLGFMYTNSETL